MRVAPFGPPAELHCDQGKGMRVNGICFQAWLHYGASERWRGRQLSKR
jgi:hypothetical protein